MTSSNIFKNCHMVLKIDAGKIKAVPPSKFLKCTNNWS